MKLGGDLIRARRQGGHKGNPDNVALGVKIERFDVFIDDANMVLAWGERSNNGQRQDAEAQHGPPRHFGLFERHPNPFTSRQHQ
jgi:hypothetical protein